MKKTCSILLICAITLLNGFTTFSYSDYNDTDETRFLNVLGIMTGYEDGTFRPDNLLNRSEAVKIIINMSGYGDKAITDASNNGVYDASQEIQFSDISKESWYWKYWNYAYQLGMVKGFEDGTARPEEALTYEEFAKMLVHSIGYDTNAEQSGGYPSGYVTYLSKLGISDNNIDKYKSLTRKTVAELAVKTMRVPLCVIDSWNGTSPVLKILDGTQGIKETLLENMNIYKANVFVNKKSDNTAEVKILSSDNFNKKAYTGEENYIFELDAKDFVLDENKSYKVLVKKEKSNDQVKYVLKFIY